MIELLLKSRQDPIMEAVEGWSMNKSEVKLMDSIVSQLNLSSMFIIDLSSYSKWVDGWNDTGHEDNM